MDETVEFVTAPVTPPDPNLSEPQMVVLARDMAWRIKPVDALLAALGLTQESFDYWVAPNDSYKRFYSTFLIEWESANSTNKRLAVKSAAALEDNLATIAARMGNAKENLPAVVETAKLFAKLAGAGEQKQQAEVGEKFTININLGNKRLEFNETIGPVIEGPTVQSVAEGTGETTAIPFLPEGSSD